MFVKKGAIEGAHAKKNSKLVSLSPQQILDCSVKGGQSGCDGGDARDGFIWATNGVVSDEKLPVS
jgi:hypothetical protein